MISMKIIYLEVINLDRLICNLKLFQAAYLLPAVFPLQQNPHL